MASLTVGASREAANGTVGGAVPLQLSTGAEEVSRGTGSDADISTNNSRRYQKSLSDSKMIQVEHTV